MDTVTYKGKQIPLMVIPRGTVLFRAVEYPESDFTGADVRPGKRCIPSNYNVFFYTNPFVVDGIRWFQKGYPTVTAYQVVHDLRIVLLVKPSPFSRSTRHEKNAFILSCDKVKDMCIEGREYDPCFRQDFLEHNRNVHGFAAVAGADSRDLSDAIRKGTVSKNQLKLFKDERNFDGPLELAIYPLNTRSLEDVFIEHPVEWKTAHMEQYNYMPIVNLRRNCADRQNFIDMYTSYNETTGFFRLRDKPVSKMVDEDSLYNSVVSGVPAGKIAIFICGATGTGKTTVREQLLKRIGATAKMVSLNIDELHEKYPSASHEELRPIYERLMNQVVTSGLPFVYDGTCRNRRTVMNVMQAVKQRGYTVILGITYTTLPTAIDRAMKRTQRPLPEDIVRDVYQDIEQKAESFFNLKELDEVYLFNNEKDPLIILEKRKGRVSCLGKERGFYFDVSKYCAAGMEDYFPRKAGVNYAKMQMTEEAVYSVTRRKEGDDLEKYMRSKIPDIEKKSVVDTTANVGSDTLRFSQMFKSVDSFEINPENAAALKNNVAVFGAKNVNVFVADSTKEFDWETDVLYADPPWGGPDYYKKKNLDLMMGSVRMDSWLKERIESDEPPKYIILKVPQNYNFERIKSLGVKSSDTKRIGNIVVIFMEVY